MKRNVERSTFRPAAASVLVVVILAAIPSLGGGAVQAASEPALHVLGELPGQPAPDDMRQAHIVQLDAPRRRLYFHHLDRNQVHHLIEYDISSELPRKLREAAVPDFPGNSARLLTTLDSRRRSLYFIDPYGNGNPGTDIRVFNLSTFRMESKAWSLLTALPGFIATGITYAAQDDRVYLVGRLSGQGTVQSVQDFGATPVGPPTVVAGLDPETRTVSWFRVVTECVQPMAYFGLGGFIGRSVQRDALYFFCISGAPPTAAIIYPGVTGLTRLTIAPKASQNEALNFPVEFFPVSGSYSTNGGTAVAGMDRPSDRVFVQSISATTPGAWVFDGSISSWIGLIAAPDALDLYLGVNEGNGHYYMSSSIGAGGHSYVLVSNARMTPPPQGDLYDVAGNGDIVTDPLTRRFFISIKKKGVLSDRIYVVKDNTPDPEQEQPVDYDDLTTDVAEGAGTISAYSGAVNGFGARAFLVGGFGGLQSFAGGSEGAENDILQSIRDNMPESVKQMGVPAPAVQRGDRGVYLARVGALDLRNSGAASSAQALAPDSGTDSEYGTYQKFLESGAAKPLATALVWPYPAATCLDGGGDAQHDPKPNADAFCDLDKNESSAKTSMAALAVGPVTIAGASFDAISTRTDKDGAVTTTTAIAKGIEFSLDGVGSVSIGRVTATARTVAHGRPGTADVDYGRLIQDVIVKDASGKETFSCAATCDPESVANSVNTTLGSKVRMDVPPVDKRATTRGAFASVRKTLRDFVGGQAQNNDSSYAVPAIEFTINNDSAGKSRLHVQLASIQAASIYGISLLSDSPVDGGVLPPIPVPVPDIIPPGPINPGPGIIPPIINNPGRRTFLRGALLLARSPKDAAVVLLIFALMAASVGAAFRRHTLIRHLEDEG